MKKLVLGSLVLAAVSQAAGCIITTDDGGDYAIVSAQWSVKNIAGQTLSCPPGITVAAVYAQEVDTGYNRVGQPFVETYPCDAGGGNSDPLPPSVYEMWVELTDASGNMVYATSTSRNEASPTEKFPDGYFVDVVDVDKTFKTTIYSDGGYFQFDWDTRNAAGAPIACNDVGFLWTSVTNGNYSADESFYCDRNPAKFGLSGEIMQGSYTIAVSAVDAQNRALGPDTTLTNKQIQSPNKVTDLGTIMVQVGN